MYLYQTEAFGPEFAPWQGQQSRFIASSFGEAGFWPFAPLIYPHLNAVCAVGCLSAELLHLHSFNECLSDWCLSPRRRWEATAREV